MFTRDIDCLSPMAFRNTCVTSLHKLLASLHSFNAFNYLRRKPSSDFLPGKVNYGYTLTNICYLKHIIGRSLFIIKKKGWVVGFKPYKCKS